MDRLTEIMTIHAGHPEDLEVTANLMVWALVNQDGENQPRGGFWFRKEQQVTGDFYFTLYHNMHTNGDVVDPSVCPPFSMTVKQDKDTTAPVFVAIRGVDRVIEMLVQRVRLADEEIRAGATQDVEGSVVEFRRNAMQLIPNLQAHLRDNPGSNAMNTQDRNQMSLLLNCVRRYL